MSEWRSSKSWLKRLARLLKELVLAILVVILPAVVWLMVSDHQSFAANRASAVGTVVERDLICGGHVSCVSEITIEFVTDAGRSVRADMGYESKPVGSAVTVYYDATKPNYAQLDSGLAADTVVMIVTLVICWLALVGRFIGKFATHRERQPAAACHSTGPTAAA